MKSNLFPTTFLIVVLLMLSFFTSAQENENSPVIVELFTSQGCSSCPSADRVLTQLIDRANKEKLPIIGLSFHVHYWDYLGWKDPYARTAYTDRQRHYAQVFGNSNIYTPQMVINGKTEFVGSNQLVAMNTVDDYLKTSNKEQVSITHLTKENNQIKIDFKVESQDKSSIINLALVERNLENDVSRGENRGRKLAHDNVVRVFKTIKFESSGTHYLSFPKNINLEESSVVVYTQNPDNYRVLGAIQKNLSELF